MKVQTRLVTLAGQPNCGKSTVFNMLTGAHQHVANYPGVTVEKKSGRFNVEGVRVDLVDLTGTYSLTSYSLLPWPGRRRRPSRRDGAGLANSRGSTSGCTSPTPSP